MSEQMTLTEALRHWGLDPDQVLVESVDIERSPGGGHVTEVGEVYRQPGQTLLIGIHGVLRSDGAA